MSHAQQNSESFLKRARPMIVVASIWGVLLLASRQYMAANDLGVSDLVAELQELLTGHWYGILLYIIAYMIRPVLLFPASLLTALAGNIWGLWLGFVIALVAGTLSAVVPYAGGRWFAPSEDRFSKVSEQDSRIIRFIDGMRKRPFQTILTMRLLYLPYDTVSALAGGLRMGFVPFFIATAIGNIAGTFAFVGIGASIEGDLSQGEFSLDPVVFVSSIVIFIISLAINYVLRSREEDQALPDDVAQERNEADGQDILITESTDRLNVIN